MPRFRRRALVRWSLSFSVLALYTSLLIVSDAARASGVTHEAITLPAPVIHQRVVLPALPSSILRLLRDVATKHPVLLPILFPQIS